MVNKKMGGSYKLFGVLRKVKYVNTGLLSIKNTLLEHGCSKTWEQHNHRGYKETVQAAVMFPNSRGICPYTAVLELRGTAGNTGVFSFEKQEFH